MDEIKEIIINIGNIALEANIKIAALAIISNSGNIIHQTRNFDLTNQTNIILNVFKGNTSFVLSDLEFIITGKTSNGIIGTNKDGMGHVIIVPFQGGFLVSYAMPQEDPIKVLTFLKTFPLKLNGKV
jgi:hypothetical protein